MNRTIFFISDGTAITAETLGYTLLTQFEDLEYRQVTLPFIDDLDKAKAAVGAINRAAEHDERRPLVFSTMTDDVILETIRTGQALVLDLFSVFIQPLEEELGTCSSHASGRSHGMWDGMSYNTRIDAVNFALQHDDGASVRHYDDAEVILVGVSRSGKTPTCVYLAMHFGILAANYPLTPDELEGGGDLPKVLRRYRQKLFGLSIDPDRLQQIRNGRRPDSRYASLPQCNTEVRDAEALFRSERIPYLNTTTISIEEIASKLLQHTGLRRRYQ